MRIIFFLLLISMQVSAKDLSEKFRYDPSYFLLFEHYKKEKLIINFYREPNLGGGVYLKHDRTKDKRVFIAGAFEVGMDDHQCVAYDKSGDFYLVKYKGEPLWVHKDNFYKIKTVNEYFKPGESYREVWVDFEKALVFDENFKPVTYKLLERFIPVDDRIRARDTFVFTISKVKRIKGKLWVFGDICGAEEKHWVDGDCANYVKGLWIKLYDKGKAKGWWKSYPKLEGVLP